MTGNRAQIDGGSRRAVTEIRNVAEALERLRYQRNYLAGAESGLAKLIAEDPGRGGSILLTKPGRKTETGKRHDV